VHVPRLATILTRLADAIDEEIAPAITEDYARLRAEIVARQLRGLGEMWERLPDLLRLETDELLQALAVAGDLVDGAAATSTLAPEEVELWRDQRQDVYQLAELHDVVAQRTSDMLRSLAAAPQTPSVRSARALIRDCLRRQAERRDPKLDAAQRRHAN